MEEATAPAVDQLKQLALDAKPSKLVVRDLDLRRYRAAITSGAPIPCFASKRARSLKSHQVHHIISSPLSEEFYEVAHGVDAMIVRHLRRLHREGNLPARDDCLEVVLYRDEIKVLDKRL